MKSPRTNYPTLAALIVLVLVVLYLPAISHAIAQVRCQFLTDQTACAVANAPHRTTILDPLTKP